MGVGIGADLLLGGVKSEDVVWITYFTDIAVFEVFETEEDAKDCLIRTYLADANGLDSKTIVKDIESFLDNASIRDFGYVYPAEFHRKGE